MEKDGFIIGRAEVYTARYKDTLLDIARNFETGITELRMANPGVDIWLPGEGTPIQLPLRFILPSAPRSGLVVNVPEMRIYYYPKGDSSVYTWPISTGRIGWETPLGETSIVRKTSRPTWFPPQSIRNEAAKKGRVLPQAIGPGRYNPLGSHALYLGFPAYLIHGTNKPYSIGMRVSHGCIRMYPEHIVEVFDMVKTGTPVNIVYQVVKVGWEDNNLYIEVHPGTGTHDEEKQPDMSEAVEVITSFIEETLEDKRPLTVDWEQVEKALDTASGIPVAVGSLK